jgi:hypothetical protein
MPRILLEKLYLVYTIMVTGVFLYVSVFAAGNTPTRYLAQEEEMTALFTLPAFGLIGICGVVVLLLGLAPKSQLTAQLRRVSELRPLRGLVFVVGLIAFNIALFALFMTIVATETRNNELQHWPYFVGFFLWPATWLLPLCAWSIPSLSRRPSDPSPPLITDREPWKLGPLEPVVALSGFALTVYLLYEYNWLAVCGPYRFFSQCAIDLDNHLLRAAVGAAVLVVLYPPAAQKLRDVGVQLGEFILASMGRIIALALAAGVLFWWQRDEYLMDGDANQLLAGRIQSEGFVFTTEQWTIHDETLEIIFRHGFMHLFVRVGDFSTNLKVAYQATSCLAGIAFVTLLLLYGRQAHGSKGFLFAVLVMGAGYIQLFFGEVEHYSLAAAAIMGFFFASNEYIAGRCSLLWPTAALGFGIMCHFLAGTFVPTLLYLGWVAYKRGEIKSVYLANILMAVIGLGVILGLHYAGILDLKYFVERSHMGTFIIHGRSEATRYVATYDPKYIRALFDMLCINCLPICLLISLLGLGRFRDSSRWNHLVIASLSGIGFFLTYRAQIHQHDWSLFAPVFIPVHLLMWGLLTEAKEYRFKGAVATLYFTLSAILTTYWVFTY